MTTLLGKPELGLDTLIARPYQERAISRVREEFRKHRSTCIIHPTGTGKTVTFGKIARLVVAKGGNVLVVAHRKELINQAARTFERLGIMAGIEKASSYARSSFEPDVVIASLQTLKGSRLDEWARDHFRLVIFDEAHHATASSYQKILAHFDAKVLGVTATPDRADQDNISDVFETIADEMTIWEAMTAPPPGPYLCRLLFAPCKVDIDLRQLSAKAGDFSDEDLADRISPHIEVLANAIRQETGDRKTLVFTPTVKVAMGLATALDSIGVSADWVSGDCSDRDQKVARYQNGFTRVLVNCNLLTEGFDDPSTSALVPLRPTKSRAFFAQMVGRVTRLAPNKPNALIVDFNYLTSKHDLVRPADLFDSVKDDHEVTEIFNEITAKRQDSLPLDLIAVAKEARKEQAERKLLRIQARRRDVKYVRVIYDPLAVSDAMGFRFKPSSEASYDRASDRQASLLSKLGVMDAQSLSRRQASKWIEWLMPRVKAGMATVKQVSWLIAQGVDPQQARSMTKEQASQILSQQWGKRR